MGVGQLVTYWSIAELPQMMKLQQAVDNDGTWIILSYAILHFLVVGAVLSAGIALAEASLSALLAIGVVEHKAYQGLAQGFYSAINQLGSTVGPPIMGWLLAMKSPNGLPPCNPISVLPTAPDVQFGMQDGIPTLVETWAAGMNENGTNELLLNKVMPVLPINNLWDLTMGPMMEAAPSVVPPPLPGCLPHTARPLLPFVVGAVLAFVPLTLWKRILSLAQSWEK
eukprot:Blabericola_migrator_1__13240@NODE_91_length_14555_cov_140_209277_g81_i0_p8_GENE_NODE_91_length_14555_cov_140_209277_g81_i0NODE_91_length_14555_cov_140_209277_g81_i0_p8_ORF_typecomplete_len225_score28_49MFS_1/PF07690_16/2_1e05MFS_1/PF07690_16/7_3e02_NODE_91_length_14555_cov_140_209277_g81_i07781452